MLHPRDWAPHFYLAEIYKVLTEYGQAQQHLEQADKLYVHPLRLTPEAQAEIQAQVMRAQTRNRR